MKFLGLGANLFSERYGSPQNTLGFAMEELKTRNIIVRKCSSWYESAPVPVSEQPNYINAVVLIETSYCPHELIRTLLNVETLFGRTRIDGEKNPARTIDLDPLVYDNLIVNGSISKGVHAIVPHPRMIFRNFVLTPLFELCPDWIDPVSGRHISRLIKELPRDQLATLIN